VGKLGLFTLLLPFQSGVAFLKSYARSLHWPYNQSALLAYPIPPFRFTLPRLLAVSAPLPSLGEVGEVGEELQQSQVQLEKP